MKYQKPEAKIKTNKNVNYSSSIFQIMPIFAPNYTILFPGPVFTMIVAKS